MGEVRFKGTADYSQAVKAIDNVLKTNEKLKQKLKEMVTASKKGADVQKNAMSQLAKELHKAEQGATKLKGKITQQAAATLKAAKAEKELARAAAKVKLETIRPTEKYNAKLKQLGTLLGRNKISQEEYNRAVRRAKSDLNEAASSGTRAFGPGMLGNIMSAAAAYVSVSQGIRLVIAAIRDKEEAERKAKETTVTLAEAQIAFRRNLGAATVAEQSAVEGRLAAISEKAGVPMRDLLVRASTAVSARGNLSVATALDAVEASVQIAPESVEVGEAITGAALDLAKATGVKDVNKTLGLLIEIGKTARVTDIGKLAENVAPAITGVVARGGTGREAGALFSALSGGGVDQTGRKTATATIQLAEQLAKFLPKEATFKTETKRGRERRVVDVEGTGLKSTLERIRYLQEHPLVKERFLQDASFEVKARASIEQIVAGKGAASDAFNQFLKRIPTAAQAGPAFDQLVKVIQAGPVQGVAAEERTQAAAVESLRTTTKTGLEAAKAGVNSAEALDELLQAAGFGFAERTNLVTLRFRTDFGSTNVESFQKQLRTAIRFLETKDARDFGEGDGRLPKSMMTTDPERLKQARILRRRLDEDLVAQHNFGRGAQPDVVEAIDRQTAKMEQLLDGIQGASQQTTDAVKENTRRLPQHLAN